MTLRDGRVLMVGGATRSGGSQQEVALAQIYDPETRRWRSVAPMLRARAQHALTLLANGKVLVTGGSQSHFSYSTSTAEIFDPETETWSEASRMSTSRRAHGAVLLPTGDVLVTGGYPDGVRTSEIYVPCE